MTKPLALSDFRAVRVVLEDEDFAIAPEVELPPSDVVDEDTWGGIMTLPDDVSVRTSNHHGTLLRAMHKCWGAWIDSLVGRREPIENAILDVADEVEAAAFNSLHGYYRQGFGCLRNALETMTIATYCQVRAQRRLFWQREAGNVKIEFGEACDKLVSAPRLRTLRANLRKDVNDSFFDPMIRNVNRGGWARRLYSDLSEYEHSRPKFRNVDMWESNGPVFSSEAFTTFAMRFYETSALCFLMVKMARPAFVMPKSAQDLWKSTSFQPSAVAALAHRILFKAGRL